MTGTYLIIQENQTMRTRILLLAAVVMSAGIFTVSVPSVCKAGWCPSYKCWGSSSCLDCVCLSRDFTGGICVDIQFAPTMQANGWTVLP